MATNEPMTGERLANMKEHHRTYGGIRMGELLVEIDRLRAREQALAAENEQLARELDEAIQDRDAERDARARTIDDSHEEIEQLQAQIGAMRPIMEAVAADLFTNIDTYERCGWRDGCRPVWSEHFTEWRHALDCRVTQARAFVAAHLATATAAESEGE